jgi:tetratricopeptide (TPR) repeat protein
MFPHVRYVWGRLFRLRGKRHKGEEMKPLATVLPLFAFFLFAINVFSQAEQTLRYNYEYSCNKERIVVGHCRHDSDMAGYALTKPEDDYCQVYYPDRPKTGGFEAMGTVLRGDVIKTLSACGALKTQVSDEPSEVDESVVEFHRGDALFKRADYASALPHFKHSNELARSSAAYAMIGITEYHLKQYTDAIGSLKEAIKMAPDSPEVHYWLGMSYKDRAKDTKESADYANAEGEFRTVLRLKPDYKAIYYWLGTVLYIEHKNAEALQAFQQALRLEPTSEPTKYLMGFTYVELGRKEDAMQVYRELLSVDPKSADDLLKRINEGPVTSKAPAPGTFEFYLNEAGKYRDKKDYPKAIENYKRAIFLKPSSAVAQLNLGFCYYKLNQYQAALAPLQQAVKLAPKDNDNQFWLGVTYYKLKQYQQAKATLQEAIRLDPTSEASHYNLGETYLYGFQQYDKAAAEYSEAIRLDPKDDFAYNQLGLAYLWQDKFADALAQFQTAYRLKRNDPDGSPQYLQNIGIAYFRFGKKAEASRIYDQLRPLDAKMAKELLDLINGTSASATNSSPAAKGAAELVAQAKKYVDADDYANAIETSKKLIALDPRSADGWGFLALSYKETKKWQLAIDAFAKYIALTKPDSSAYRLYAECYIELEQYDKAIPLFQRALALDVTPDDKADTLFKIGDAYYEMNDYAKALEPFRQVTVLTPKDDDALYHLGMCYMGLGKKAEAQQVQKKLETMNRISAGNLQTWIDGMK